MTSNIKWMPSILAALLAPAAPAAAQDAAESPYFDIQWNSAVVGGLLSADTGMCQADADADAAPIESKLDTGKEWPRTLKPSVLRAMFYLAYDYYGMGLNHYFALRQDLTPDYNKRFAGAKPIEYQANGRTVKLVPLNYVAFKAYEDPDATSGRMKVAARQQEDSTKIYHRHSVVDPFDQELLADRIHHYRIVGLSVEGQKKTTPMDISVNPDMLREYYFLGTFVDKTGLRRAVGLQLMSAFYYPGTGSDGKPDYQSYRYESEFRLQPVRAPYRMGGDNFGKGMLAVEIDGSQSALYNVCAQWRMQQERKRDGQATDSDRLLEALMRRANFDDEHDGLWIIPAEGY